MDLISLVIINYNNKLYLERCIESILEQSYKKIEIIFIDNASKDGSYEYMKEKYEGDNILIIKNSLNNGYSGAANQGIRKANGKYVMILNPDIIMENDFIEKLYNFAELNSNVAAISGKLLKYDFDSDRKLNIIDSTGIIMNKDRSFEDRGQNTEDKGQYNNVERVFGVCGAAPFYNKELLNKLAINNEYFDEDFFAYKEDVDLSWRINLYGYRCMYLPDAIAYHGRAFDKNTTGIVEYIKNRKAKSLFVRQLSFRNNLLLQIKNETKESRKKFIFLKWKRNVKYFVFSLIIEPKVLISLKDLIRLKKKMKDKNKVIVSNIKDINNFQEVIF